MPRPPATTDTAKRGHPPKSATGGASSAATSRRGAQPSRPADPFLSSDEEADRSRIADADPDSDDAVEVLDSDSYDVDDTAMSGRGAGGNDEDEEPPEKVVPPALVTRLLQEMFRREGTRMTADASQAAAKYVDVFVREAIARCIHEREGAFLEVDDLEKIAAQLLLDF
ncbi:hypothetical protein SODALDRAFT_325746 [Sodiomyces alkalinus F11]|uniref:Centromere protein X n=1 Tax=Sodiomyces alkalinus (strain CBS 110278 / VKM F-3762 / F11) TaxID=1314773 RepID=A0A3N2PPM3_SODAK|nr:hypothetical protein SODALDRAFT_325746 [Sodiomyces alkalinus F11]ROT36404.1 hypothetical protein SODALDRAFT_325746 [Sodiomyces alkalinus F11]